MHCWWAEYKSRRALWEATFEQINLCAIFVHDCPWPPLIFLLDLCAFSLKASRRAELAQIKSTNGNEGSKAHSYIQFEDVETRFRKHLQLHAAGRISTQIHLATPSFCLATRHCPPWYLPEPCVPRLLVQNIQRWKEGVCLWNLWFAWLHETYSMPGWIIFVATWWRNRTLQFPDCIIIASLQCPFLKAHAKLCQFRAHCWVRLWRRCGFSSR